MPLTDHPTGGYRFLPGIAPYSCGVVSAPGFEIAHVTLHAPVTYRRGFDVIERHLASEGRPRTALCGVELRSPCPFSFEGFAEFNAGYARILEGWGLFVSKLASFRRAGRGSSQAHHDPRCRKQIGGLCRRSPVQQESFQHESL